MMAEMDARAAVELTGVAQLRTLGRPEALQVDTWADYGELYDLGADDVDALIAIACDSPSSDDEEDLAAWAPVHAWRALGQLRAEAAVQPLLDFAASPEWGDWVSSDLPHVFGMIGNAAIAPLRDCLCAPALPQEVRTIAATGLAEIGERFPDTRPVCVAVLADALAPEAAAQPSLAGFVVASLLDLEAVEAIGAIRDVYARRAVEESVAGDLEDVEIDLGLRDVRATPRRHYLLDQPAQPMRERALAKRDEVGRNDPCLCGSGKKYKKCCLNNTGGLSTVDPL